ncbi:hypothetical protein LPJ61_005424, partial [Coemansia biformis]
MGASSPSRVHSQTFMCDAGGQSLISDDRVMVINKPVVVYNIMHEECPRVIARLYPWCMGKTTFLDLLKNFLAVVSDTPYGECRTRYNKLAIYDCHKAFFDEHFGCYAVFKLDLKGLKETKAIHLAHISILLPELMEVFFRLFGCRSVLLVDDYDVTFVKAHCGIADVALHNRITNTYTNFLSECLK